MGHLTFLVQGIRRCFCFGHVDDSVDIERDLLGVGRPMLIAETIDVLSVLTCSEGVVAVRNGALMKAVSSVGLRHL
jgi:hypothetical protein